MIGLAFSGGIDSTCLAYELMLQHNDLCFITADWKDTKIFAKRVIEILEKITNKKVEHVLIPDYNNGTYMIYYGRIIQEKIPSSSPVSSGLTIEPQFSAC